MTDTNLRYFSSVKGRVATRFGRVGALIGCRRTKAGFEWNPDEVVAIPSLEVDRYRREYGRLLDKDQPGGPSLIERDKKAFDTWCKAAEEQGAKDAAAAAKAEPKAEPEAEPEPEAVDEAEDKKSASKGTKKRGG